MPTHYSRIFEFWKELKRRKVIQVITVYAASAFVILELVDILAPSLRLPDWTLNLVLLLLCVGFVIAVILSWIYDKHPEGGIIKTEPIDKVKTEDIPKSSNSWRIASYISFVVIVALIVLNIIPRAERIRGKELLDKSIAVLPFKNDSPNQERMYFINGTMEAILDNLCKIEDLRVVSRNSVEQYRTNPKSTPVVAKEMNVSYILQGSGHRDGNNVRLGVQLLDGEKDQHLWSKTYDTDIEKIFSMQSEIAQLVAAEIEAIITPEEKQLIEKTPTTNLTAYDFYQRGMEEIENGNIEKAEVLFNEALRYDSAYGGAYLGLAYIGTQNSSEDLSPNSVDSLINYINIALSYDDKLFEAYTLRAYLYHETGRTNLALRDLDKAIDLNPNYADAYTLKHYIYYASDLLEDLKASQKSVSIDRTAGLNLRLKNLAYSYNQAGFYDKSIHYYREALKLDMDTADYFNWIGELEYWQGNLNKSIELYKKSIALDTAWSRPYMYLARSLCEIGECEESLDYVVKYISRLKDSNDDMTLGQSHRIAYIYWKNGLKEEADFYFNQQIEICEKEINSDRPWAQKKYSYYDLAGVYAFNGEKEKALDNLRILNQIERAPFWLDALIKRDHLFDNIRDEPEFQQIVTDVEAKYQAEHERVRKWLEENDMF
jgi:TolB-like protein